MASAVAVAVAVTALFQQRGGGRWLSPVGVEFASCTGLPGIQAQLEEARSRRERQGREFREAE